MHLMLVGNLGNRTIQYMVALKLASLVPGCRISNVHFREWNIHHPSIGSDGPVTIVDTWERIDLVALSTALNEGRIRRVEWDGYGQRMENFLPREFYERVFTVSEPHVGFGRGHLVCPVRAGDILEGAFDDYPLTPVEFYAELIQRTGLKPVFMGQTARNAYTARLRERFPHAIFLGSRGQIGDFELIRRSKNIAIGVSIFAWLAAWLSHAEHIFMAVSGLFNPMQQSRVDLLPSGDPRYQFWLFPLNYGVPLDWHADVHRRMMPYCRLITHEALKRQIDAAPRVPLDPVALLAEFDEAYYLSTYSDVHAVVREGRLASGRAHYIAYGFRENRRPFFLHAFWYVDQYPLAALEVAQGDYVDLFHHYVAVGKSRGYRPAPY
jgi:hypothetical protein